MSSRSEYFHTSSPTRKRSKMPKYLAWDSHYKLIHQRYIEEGLSLTNVRQILAHDHKFFASERAYREKFRQWNFPSKQPKLHLNHNLVSAVHQLWKDNYSSKAMLRSLQKTYPTITKRQLDFIRHQNQILLGCGKGVERKEAQKNLVKPLLQAGLQEGQTLRYGQVYMSAYLRSQSNIFISE